ncbi:MAG: hypothetical protein AB1568_09365 [Thermodesulfobacteriota bacterium]
MKPPTSLPSFLVFSDDWGEHPSSCQHIFKHIAKDHQALWVNTIGMRGMRFSREDVRKGVLKLKKMLGRPKTFSCISPAASPPLNLHVVQPFMLPFITSRAIRKFNALSVTNTVRKKMAALNMQSPILVMTAPNAADYMDNFDCRRKVFYCVDDFSRWPGLEHTLVRQMEERLVAGCDIFIATSQQLVMKLRQQNMTATLLTHGVDAEHFSNLPSREHPLLAGISKPRVGYFGLIDERIDQKLLAQVAGALPNISFILTGTVVTDVSVLRRTQNVHWTGPVPYEELPAMVSGWQACILPYRVDETTVAINPLKLKEYLATDKPVVISALPEAKNLAKFLLSAVSAADWVSKIRYVATNNKVNPEMLRKRREYLQGETWHMKAEVLLSLTTEKVGR